MTDTAQYNDIKLLSNLHGHRLTIRFFPQLQKQLLPHMIDGLQLDMEFEARDEQPLPDGRTQYVLSIPNSKVQDVRAFIIRAAFIDTLTNTQN